MNLPPIIAECLAGPLKGALQSLLEVSTRTLGPLERMGGIKGRFSSPLAGYWLWVGVGVGAIAISVALIALLSHRGRVGRRKGWQAFVAQAEEAGLSREEQNLLAKIARTAGLSNLNSIFTSEHAFHKGVRAMAAGNDALKVGSGICVGCAFLILLREKLGFRAPPTEAKLGAIKLAPIPPGTALEVIRPLGNSSFKAVLTDSKGTEELTVVPEALVAGRAGESWVLRLAQGGTVWEFNALVLRADRERVILKPIGEIRWINRRRFVRASTRRPAYVASFPFDKPMRKGDVPEFIPAALIEIGGPGVQLIAPMKAENGQRVLVVMELNDEKLVESVGVVRRTARDRLGTRMSVELVGLNTSDITELAKATIQAAQTDEEPAVVGRPQLVATAAEES